MDSEDELAEERRLFYVGLTRARDAVYLSHAFRRTTWGDSSVAVPSRFLTEIPEDYIDGQRPGARRRESIDRASTWDTGRANWNAGRSRQQTTWGDYDRRPSESPNRTRPSESRPQEQRLPEPYSRADEPRPNRPAGPSFKTGQKVRHKKFGEGTVIESKVTGADEEVTVAFPGIGIKRLAAAIAGLEAIS